MWVTSVPLRRRVPAVGSTSRLIIRRVVVLPQPDGPDQHADLPARHLEVQRVHRDRPVGVPLRHAVEHDHRVAVARVHAVPTPGSAVSTEAANPWVSWDYVSTHVPD